jgi:hypothetical protein
MKDGAGAIGNGFREVYHDMYETTCHVHACLIWLKKHRSLFVNFDANSERITQDLNAYKELPVMSMVCIARQKMLQGWREIGEIALANQWDASWGLERLTRIECNQHAWVIGGAPADNNPAERKFRVLKAHNSQKIVHLGMYLHSTGSFIHEQSVADADWVPMSDVVDSNEFYRKVILCLILLLSPLCLT